MQGWVAVDDDWQHVEVGNERLLKVHGGKIRPSKAVQSKIDQFHESRKGELILYICIDDEIKALLSLSGTRSLTSVCGHSLSRPVQTSSDLMQ